MFQANPDLLRLLQDTRAQRDRMRLVADNTPLMWDIAFLVENARDFIGICDLDFKPVYANASAMSLLGITADDLRTMTVFDFFEPADAERLVREFFPLVQRDGHGSIETRFRHFRTGGEGGVAREVP